MKLKLITFNKFVFYYNLQEPKLKNRKHIVLFFDAFYCLYYPQHCKKDMIMQQQKHHHWIYVSHGAWS